MRPLTTRLSSIDRRCGDRRALAVGDLIRTGENFHPHYDVVAISGNSAWVREVQFGTDVIVPVARCSRVAEDLRSPTKVFGGRRY